MKVFAVVELPYITNA